MRFYLSIIVLAALPGTEMAAAATLRPRALGDA